jgi:hypothetical protein
MSEISTDMDFREPQESYPRIECEDNWPGTGFKRREAGRAPPSPWSKPGFAGRSANGLTADSGFLQDID